MGKRFYSDGGVASSRMTPEPFRNRLGGNDVKSGCASRGPARHFPLSLVTCLYVTAVGALHPVPETT